MVGPLVMKKPTPEDWKRTAEEFNIRWNFPHCLGMYTYPVVALICTVNRTVVIPEII